MVRLEKLNKRLGIGFALIGAFAIFFAARSNPTDAGKKLLFMSSDVDAVLRNGGHVVSRTQNSKYGSALIFVTIDADSWSSGLADSYTDTLRSLGWKKGSDEDRTFLCKNGARADVYRDAEYNEGKPAYGLSMSYNARTIQQCKHNENG
ncbi:hypothetical protein [Paraburkholderia caribensis]|jgi:hypothetical protein|uniref:hypothetical protein n=1 Tax=Paraburkholderia caribensis TaxID=75105 RepID=UPI0011DFA567|nr:hypothetical protein [Paraburkholderia caribensis]